MHDQNVINYKGKKLQIGLHLCYICILYEMNKRVIKHSYNISPKTNSAASFV